MGCKVKKNDSKTIVHVFNGFFYYLDKSMIHSFVLNCPDWNHIFVIFVPTVAIMEELNRFFEEKQIPSESIFYIKSVGFNKSGKRSSVMKKLIEFWDAVRIYWILFFRYRRYPLVFHGTTFALGYLFLNF